VAEILFLSLEAVLALHRRSLLEHGGSDGTRDQGGLESAVGQAMNEFYYGRADSFGVAAAYAFHIAEAQAFVDGNKRTAIAAALAFLTLNGHVGKPSSSDLDEIYEAMIAIPRHELDKAGLAALFRKLFA
jgi:death-on-curing protein